MKERLQGVDGSIERREEGIEERYGKYEEEDEGNIVKKTVEKWKVGRRREGEGIGKKWKRE